MDAAASRIDGMIERSRNVIEQRRAIHHNRIAFTAAGIALWAILPGVSSMFMCRIVMMDATYRCLWTLWASRPADRRIPTGRISARTFRSGSIA